MEKRKSGNRLGSGTTFKFISPYSLEECVKLLERKRKRWSFWSQRYVTINFIRMNEDRYQFRIVQVSGRNLRVEAKGTLERQFKNATLVRGVVHFPLFMVVWVSVFWGAVWFCIAFTSTGNIVPLFIIILLVGLSTAIWASQYTSEIKRLKMLIIKALNGSEYIGNYVFPEENIDHY